MCTIQSECRKKGGKDLSDEGRTRKTTALEGLAARLQLKIRPSSKTCCSAPLPSVVCQKRPKCKSNLCERAGSPEEGHADVERGGSDHHPAAANQAAPL